MLHAPATTTAGVGGEGSRVISHTVNRFGAKKVIPPGLFWFTRTIRSSYFSLVLFSFSFSFSLSVYVCSIKKKSQGRCIDSPPGHQPTRLVSFSSSYKHRHTWHTWIDPTERERATEKRKKKSESYSPHTDPIPFPFHENESYPTITADQPIHPLRVSSSPPPPPPPLRFALTLHLSLSVYSFFSVFTAIRYGGYWISHFILYFLLFLFLLLHLRRQSITFLLAPPPLIFLLSPATKSSLSLYYKHTHTHAIVHSSKSIKLYIHKYKYLYK